MVLAICWRMATIRLRSHWLRLFKSNTSSISSSIICNGMLSSSPCTSTFNIYSCQLDTCMKHDIPVATTIRTKIMKQFLVCKKETIEMQLHLTMHQTIVLTDIGITYEGCAYSPLFGVQGTVPPLFERTTEKITATEPHPALRGSYRPHTSSYLRNQISTI